MVKDCYFHIPQTGDVLLTTAALHCPRLSSVEISWTQLSDRALIYAAQHCIRYFYLANTDIVRSIYINLWS